MLAHDQKKEDYQYNKLEQALFAVKDAVKWLEWHKGLNKAKISANKLHYILDRSLSRKFAITKIGSKWVFGHKKNESLIWFSQLPWSEVLLIEKSDLLCFAFAGFTPEVLKIEQESPVLSFFVNIPIHPIIKKELAYNCKEIFVSPCEKSGENLVFQNTDYSLSLKTI